MQKELTNRETMSKGDKSTTRKSAGKRKRDTNDDSDVIETHENTPSDCSESRASEKQELTSNEKDDVQLFKKERDEYVLKLEEKERIIKEQEKLIEEKQKIIEQQTMFLDSACSKMKQDFLCKVCSKIYEKPVTLPCSIGVCKAHLEDLSSFFCSFCNQTHEIATESVTVNRSLEIRIALNEHLSLAEVEYKKEIENLLNETKLRTETLHSKEMALKNIYATYFPEMASKIDARRDELKVQLDEISNTLKNLVNQSKSLNEIKFAAYSLNKILDIDEIKSLENYLNDESRRVVFIRDNFESVRRDLAGNLDKVNNKLKDVLKLEKEAQEFSIGMHTNSLNFSLFGKLDYGYGFFNHLESLSDDDLKARGLEQFSKYKNWEYKKFSFWPQSA